MRRSLSSPTGGKFRLTKNNRLSPTGLNLVLHPESWTRADEQVLGSGPSGEKKGRGLTFQLCATPLFFGPRPGCVKRLASSLPLSLPQPYQDRCSLVLAFDLNCLPSLRAGVFVGVVRLAEIQYSIS